MSADQISVKLTMSDELSAKAKEGQATLKKLEAEMKGVREEVARTGKGATELKRLETEYSKVAKETRIARTEATKLRNEVRQAGTQAAKSAHTATSAWQRFRKTMGSGLVTGASIAGMVYFGKRAVEAFAEAEKGQMALQLAMEKFPAINNVTAQSFADLNTQLMNTTGADDDLLASAEGVLARFKLTGSQIQQLIPLVNDYAIATGKDVPTAAASIGKALMGNARALKELGINFKTTGDTSKDLTIIMDALQQKVGGVGEAFGQTTAGKLAIAQQNFQNLQEAIGGALVPALEGLIGVIRPAAEWFTSLSDTSKKLAVGIAFLGTAALIVVPRIIALTAQMKLAGISAATMRGGLGNVATFLTGPWGAALAIAGTALAIFATSEANASAQAEALASTLDQTTGAATALTQQKIGEEFLKNFSIADLKKTPFTLQEITSAVLAGGDAYEKLRVRVEDYSRETLKSNPTQIMFLGALANSVDAAHRDAEAMRDLANITNYASGATQIAGDSAEVAAGKFNMLKTSAKEVKTAVDEMAVSLGLVNSILAEKSAKKQYRDNLKAFIEDPNKETLSAMISGFTSAAEAIKNPRREAKFTAKGIDEIKTAARKMDVKIPDRLKRSLNQTEEAATGVQTALDNIDATKDIMIRITMTGSGRLLVDANGNGIPDVLEKAQGGLVTGPGTGTSDSIPARLSNGEYVVRAAAVRAMGVDTLEQINMADRQAPTFVTPQLVAPTTTPTTPTVTSPVVNIGEIHAESGIDVQTEVVWALRRAERIRRERSAA